jgi:hypothetical protein
MQIAAETTTFQSLPGAALSVSESPATVRRPKHSQYTAILHIGAVADIGKFKIHTAVTRALIVVRGGLGVTSAWIRGLLPESAQRPDRALVQQRTGGVLSWG